MTPINSNSSPTVTFKLASLVAISLICHCSAAFAGNSSPNTCVSTNIVIGVHRDASWIHKSRRMALLFLSDNDDESSSSSAAYNINDKNNKKKPRRQSVIAIPNMNKLPKPKSSSESTFWYSIPEKNKSTRTMLPFEPNLDMDGPLPLGSYRSSSSSSHNKKCLITIAIDTSSTSRSTAINNNYNSNNRRMINEQQDYNTNTLFDKMDIIRGMQRYIDKGLTSFQIASPSSSSAKELGEGTIFGTLWKETPRSILVNSCHLTSKVTNIPSSYQIGFKKTQIRDSILLNCLSSGAEHLDAALVPYQANSPYHLDVLDVLMDLQRDGLVKEIRGLNFPQHLIQSAKDNGFHLDSNQAPCSILDQRLLHNYEKENNNDELLVEELIASSPLAGAILTERYYNYNNNFNHPSSSTNMLAKGQYFYSKNFSNKEWNVLHRALLQTIYEISLKHNNVSMSSVALRWVLQQQQQQQFSTVVTTRVGRINRSQSYRDVFTFELDEQDFMQIERTVSPWFSQSDDIIKTRLLT